MILTTNQRVFPDLARPIQATENATGSITFTSHTNFTSLSSKDSIVISDGQKTIRFRPSTGHAKGSPARGTVFSGMREWYYGVNDVSNLNHAAESLANAINAARDRSPTDLEVTAIASTDGSGKVVVCQHKVDSSTHVKFSERGVVSGSFAGRSGTSPRFEVSHFDENLRSRFYDPPTIAYFSLNRYFDQEGSIFENTIEAGEARQLSLVTGSSNGFYSPATADLTHSSLGHSGSFSNPRIPNTPTRIFTNRIQNVVDFDNIGTKFLIVSGVNEVSPATGTGKTYMVRCLSKQTTGTHTNIISVADRDTAVFSLYSAGTKTIRAKLHAGGTDNIQVVDLAGTGYLDKWITIMIYVGPTQIGPSAVFSVEDGKTIQTAAAITGLSISSTPEKSSLYVGYGIAGQAPGLTFDVADYLNNFQIAEVAVIEGQLTHQEMKWVANSHLSSRHVSGIANPKLREVIRQIERFPAYPTVSRTGDQGRLGNRKVGFDDTRTLVFSPTASIVFPEMLPKEKIGDKYNQFVPFFGYVNSGSTRLSDRISHLGPFGPRPASYTNTPGVPMYTGKGFSNIGTQLRQGQDNNFVEVGGIRVQRPDGSFLQRGPYANDVLGEFSIPEPGVFRDTFRGQAITTSPLAEDLLRIQRNSEHFVPPRSDVSVAPEFLARETIEPFNEVKVPLDRGHLDKRVGNLLNLTSSVGNAMQIVIDLENSENLDVGSGFNETTTAAYYNFTDKKWEVKSKIESAVVTDDVDGRLSSQLTVKEAIETGLEKTTISFAGQSGFAIYPSESNPTLPLKSRARPTDVAGFPHSDAFKPSDGQKLKMSDYITEPFILQAVYFEIDGKIFEMGDEGVGYLMSDSIYELPFSGSFGKTPRKSPNPDKYFTAIQTIEDNKFNTYFGRASVIGGADIKGVKGEQYRNGTSLPDAGGKYVAGSLGGEFGNTTSNQMFIPGRSTGGNTGYVPVDMNSIRGIPSGSKFSPNPTKDPNYVSSSVGEVFHGYLTNAKSAAPYWRCDSLFILRERPGVYNEFQPFDLVDPVATAISSYPAGVTYSSTNSPNSGLGYPYPTHAELYLGAHNPLVADLAPGARNGWVSGSAPGERGVNIPAGVLKFNNHNKSVPPNPTTRELVTYSQFTHYGYVRSRMFTQSTPNDFSDPDKNSTILKNSVMQFGEIPFPGLSAHCDPDRPATNLPNTFGLAGGFINMPVDFVDLDSDTSWTPYDHLDYRDYGSFERPGDKTGLTLLEAGLGRDRNYLVKPGTNVSLMSASIERSANPYNKVSGNGYNDFNTLNFPRACIKEPFVPNTSDSPNFPHIADRTFKVFAPCRQPTRTGDVAGLTFSVSSKYLLGDFLDGGAHVADLFVTFPSVPSNSQRAPELSSGRSYIKAVPGKTNSNQSLLRYASTGPKGMPSPLASTRIYSENPHKYLNGPTMVPDKILVSSGTLSDTYEEESPYILYPEDEIIIGFAPSTAGGNEGTGRIINPSTPDTVYGFGFDNINSHLKTQRDSLDLAASIFRLKKGPGKVILYGTRVSDGKKVPPTLNQELTTLSAHEVIGESMTPLDEFMTAQEGEYMGSRLTKTITGSIAVNYFDETRFTEEDVFDDPTKVGIQQNTRGGVTYKYSNIRDLHSSFFGDSYAPFRESFKDQSQVAIFDEVSPRGVSGDLNLDGTLSTSGSFNRFIQLVDPGSNSVLEDATYYTDTTVPQIQLMWERDGTEVGFQRSAITISGVSRTLSYLIADTATGNGSVNRANFKNGRWRKSFPFEARYRGVATTDYEQGNNIPRLLGLSTGRPALLPGTDMHYYFTSSNGSLFPFLTLLRMENFEQGNFNDALFEANSPHVNYPAFTFTQGSVQQRAFAETSIKKEVLSVFYGFGNGCSGSLATRTTGGSPLLYYGFRQSFSHPSGWKYGLSNVVPTRRKFIFRPDRFGQFRDMLEQPLDSSYGSQMRKPGALGGAELGTGLTPDNLENLNWFFQPAVFCKFMDSEGQQLPSDKHELTSCNNLSKYATSSMPYFDTFDNLANPVVSRDIIFAPADVFVSVQRPELPDFPNLDFSL